MKIALLSNVNVESLARRLKRGHDVFVAPGFGAWAQELTNPQSATSTFAPQLIFLLLDGRELLKATDGAWASIQQELENTLQWLRSPPSPPARLFVSTLDIPPRIDSLTGERAHRNAEAYWDEQLRTIEHITVFELKEIIEQLGRTHAYDPKLWYAGGMRFSIAAEKVMANELNRVCRAVVGQRKKCLALDLDNTLWGGVIGEEGLEGIELSDVGLGARYKDFQRSIKRLQELGVILTIVSKNNEPDALEAFEKHDHMALQLSDFAAHKINWQPKPLNLKALAEDLNIGLDSFVFVDDNPVERGAVQSALPQVAVPDFPMDTARLSDFMEEIYREHFLYLASTQEDQKKTEMYRQNAMRAEAAAHSTSEEDYLKSLQTEVVLWPVKEEDIARAAQLTQKTNQFNFTTKRYTEDDMRQFVASDDHLVYIASVKDRFGDSGKTFLAIIDLTDKAEPAFDTLLMSCRVMGRYLEDQLFAQLCSVLRDQGSQTVWLPYTATAKNEPARMFSERLLGKAESGGKRFDLSKNPTDKPAFAQLRSL